MYSFLVSVVDVDSPIVYGPPVASEYEQIGRISMYSSVLGLKKMAAILASVSNDYLEKRLEVRFSTNGHLFMYRVPRPWLGHSRPKPNPWVISSELKITQA